MIKTSHHSLRPALFLDRDGVVNWDKNYVHTVEQTEFVEGVFELVSKANRLGYKVIIITNQAGIGRGYYTQEQFLLYMDWMLERFETHGAHIDAVYFCPHHPQHGLGEYKQACDCRKPKPGMILTAAKEHSIDLSASIMLGDKDSDMKAAQAAGIGSARLVENHVLPNLLLRPFK